MSSEELSTTPSLSTSEVSTSKWRRAVLKISGEALASSSNTEVIDALILNQIAEEVVEAADKLKVELAIVVGGGNIWRSAVGAGAKIERATSDHMGMLATTINALAMQNAIERIGYPTRVQSAIQMAELAEPYIRRKAVRHLEKGRIVIFAAGTGNPYFTTDTAAALRAAEIDAEVVLKGTHSGIDGIYSADPKLDPAATKYDYISFMDVVSKELKVMDLTAITFCKDNNLPVHVFDLMKPGNILRALRGEELGTFVS